MVEGELMKSRIVRAIAAALFVLGLLAAGTAPYGDPDTPKPHRISVQP